MTTRLYKHGPIAWVLNPRYYRQTKLKLKWTSKALSDLVRLYEYLVTVNQRAAVRTVQTLTAAPTALLRNSRIGEQLFEFEPREVRRIFVAQYEMRYEIQNDTIYVLRLWHTREDR